MNDQVATAPADIAVVGLSCRFPGADDPYEYWRNIREGVESIRFHSDEELRARGVPEHLLTNPRYVKASAPLAGAEEFDAAFFGFSAREAEVMDPQHRHFLECAHAALEDAGYDPGRYDGLIGVYAGSTMNTYLPMNLMANRGVLDVVGDLQIMIGNDKEYLASRVSYKLDLRGPSYVIQTACSSSLAAIHVATQALLSGECDMALAGGSSIRMPPGGGYLHQPGGTSSPDGHCRAFDAAAGGSVVGSGAGVAVLKHLSDAIRDGDHIYAVIKGTAINNDGATKVSFTAPSVQGQARAAAGAMLAARVEAEEIGFVEAHGTGTPLGDPIEVAALTQAFRQTTARSQFCALGSVKTNIGHLDAAAGIAGFIKAVQAVRYGLLPPTLHFERPNPELKLETSPFFVSNQLLEWESDGPRIAAVNSIGMGGTNAHVILQEPPQPSPSTPARRGQLLLLSARTATALESTTERLARWLREHPTANLADVAYTLQVGRRPMAHRRAVVVRDVEDATYALAAPTSKRIVTRHAEPPAAGVAFLFPGQGTQFVTMATRLHESVPAFRAAVDECLAALPVELAQDLRTLLLGRHSTDELAGRLRDTARAQPALFVVEYALTRTLTGLGVTPTATIGHSVGEITAAVVGGTLRLADALAFVTARGRLLSRLPGGTMLGVALSEERVRDYLVDGVEISAVNGPEQTTLGGPADAVDAVHDRLVADRVGVQRLHVSHAFHTAVVDPVLDELAAVLDGVELRPPTIPWVSNVTGRWITAEQATDPRYWAGHARAAVRFADGLAALTANHPDLVLLEVGPGAVLGALARAAGVGRETVRTMRGPRDDGDDGQLLLQAVGTLWAQGVDVDWTSLWTGTIRHRVSLPTYPFERQRYWADPVPQSAAAVPLAAAPEESTDRRPSPVDWWYLPVWSQLPPVTGQSLADQDVVLVGGGSELAGPLAERLRAAGTRVVVVTDPDTAAGSADAHPVRPDDDTAWDRVLAGFGAAPGRTRRLVSLAGLTATGGDDPTDELAALLATVPAVRALHRNHGPDRPWELVVVTAGAVDVRDPGELRPAQAAVLAAALLPQQEIPDLRARAVDLAPDATGAELAGTVAALAAELSTPDGPPLVALRRGRRWSRSYARWQPDRTPAAGWRRDGVHVIVGGLGFFGRTAARQLLGQLSAHVVLVDRRPVPPREQWAAAAAGGRDRVLSSLVELTGLGGSVEVVTADGTDAGALREVLASTVARHGRIDAVVFAAGPAPTEGVAALHEVSPGTVRAHAETVVAGLRALDTATAGLPVETCLVVTSLATVLGGLASGPYTATSLWADAFAAGRTAAGAGPRWTSVAWEHWRQPGETSLGGQRERYALDPDELAETVELAFATTVERAAVSTAALDPRIEAARRSVAEHVRAAARKPTVAAHSRPALNTPYVAPRGEVEEHITHMMAQLLGVEPVGVRDNFFELDGDSLMAMQLVSHLRDHYRVDVPMSDLFEDPTAASLAACVESRLDADGRSAQTAGPGPSPVERPAPARSDDGGTPGDAPAGPVDADIEEILASASPEEVERLLAELEERG